MKQSLWKKVKYPLLFISLAAVSKFCLLQTSYFTVSIIQNTATPSSAFYEGEFPLDANQKYKLFDRGRQSFAFVSDDGKYVLKIFTKKHRYKKFCYKAISHLFPFAVYAKKQIQLLESKEKKFIESLQIANNFLKEKTAILYLHTSKQQKIPKTFRLIDNLNIEHSVDLSHSCFVLQKKGILLFDYLRDQKKFHNEVEAQKTLTDVIDYLIFREKIGIDDKDPLLRKNFAIINHNLAQIDIGSFQRPSKIQSLEYQKKEFLRIIASLQEFIDKEYLELKGFLDNLIDDKIREYFE